MSKRTIITFEPDADIAKDLPRAIRLRAGRGGYTRGIMRQICNEALRAHFASTLPRK